MEYLVVYFDEDRGVIVNDAPGDWMTNQPFMLQAGSYTIELATFKLQTTINSDHVD